MPLKYFSQLDGLSMPASIIILDIDGTIVFDGSDEITPDVLANIKKFNSVSRVYLSSNNKMTDRNNKLSELSEVPYIRTKLRKPNPKAVRDINIGCGHVAVIGDKFLTDGLLAIFIGAEFIKVRRLTSNNDSRLARFLCFCDDSAFNIFLMLKLMRVKHWSKNILVFSSLFFAREIFDLDKIALVFLAWLGFSLTASSIYIINDIFDRKNDSLHPVKKYRPIANGDISVPAGACMAMILLIFGLLLGFMSGVYVSILLLFYFFLNLAYSSYLKNLAIIDIILISFFYLLRVMAGGLAMQASLSGWIILCVFFAAMLLIAGKRLAELRQDNKRKVLNSYSKDFLNNLLVISACLTLITYGLYSILASFSPWTVYSNIFVVCGVLYYVLLVGNNRDTEFPEEILFKDKALLLTIAGWLIFMLIINYE